MATIASMTMDGKMVVHLDRWGERGIVLQVVAEDLPPTWLVELQSWGFENAPAREPLLTVRAISRFAAVRRLAGAALLVYEDDDHAPLGGGGERRIQMPAERERFRIIADDELIPPTDHIRADQAFKMYDLWIDQTTEQQLALADAARTLMKRLSQPPAHHVRVVDIHGPHGNGHKVALPLDLPEFKTLAKILGEIDRLDDRIIELQRLKVHLRRSLQQQAISNGNGDGNGERAEADGDRQVKLGLRPGR